MPTISGPLPRVYTGSVETQCQMTMVNDFAAHSFLGQNIQQCEIVMLSHGRGTGSYDPSV